MGWVGTLLLNGMVGLGAYTAARYGLRQPPGLPRTLAAATLAWAWVTVGLEGLGSLGLLAVGPLAAWAAAGLVLGGSCRLWPGRRGPLPTSEDTGPGVGAWGPEATLGLGLTLAACAMLGATSLMGPVKVVSDGPIYHLYFAVRWWKAHRLEPVPVPFGESAATYFPAVGDLWSTWLLVTWGGDRLAKVGQAPFLLLAALAAYALARRLGAGRSASALAACWFATIVPLALFSFEPNVDTIFVAGYLVAAFFFLRYALGDAGPAALAPGALAAGGAWGTKPTGAVFVPPLLALAAVAVLVRGGRSWRARLGHLALLAALPLVMAGFWFARNAIRTGNPLYPLDVPALGWTGWYAPEAMRRSPYYLPRADVRALGDILLAVLDPRLAPVWVAAMAGAWRIGAGGRRLAGWIWLAAALAVGNVALYWWLIPYRTQQRFMLQAFGLAAVPLARAFDRGRAVRWGALGLLALHLGTAQGWPIAAPGRESPWDLSPIIPNAIGPLVTVPIDPIGLVSVLALVVAAMAAAWTWGLLAVRVTPARGLAAAAAGMVPLAVGITLFTSAEGPRWADPFFPPFRDFVRGWRRLDRLSGPGGTRVAYAGTNIPYYLFCRGLRNDVRYVNVDPHRAWLMHDYHRGALRAGQPRWPNPRPGWDRSRPHYPAWLANLRAAGIELLVVARANPSEGSHNPNPADPLGFPIERAWAETHPRNFVPLYGVAESDPRFRIYRVLPERPAGPSLRAGPVRSLSESVE